MAKTILESGRGNFFSGPDLSARRQVMAREVAASIPSDGAAILKTLAQKTDLFTLLDFRDINRQVEEDSISLTEREALANAFAYAYNSNQLEEFLTFDHSQARDMVKFLDSSSRPEVQSFKESYAKLMVESALRDDALPHVQMNAAHLAGHIMSTEPELAASLLKDLKPEQLKEFFTLMDNAGPILGHNPPATGEAAVYHDNWTAVLNALSQVPTEKLGNLPADLSALMVAEKAKFDDSTGEMLGTQRAEALTQFLGRHGSAALEALTNPDYAGQRGIGSNNSLGDEAQTKALGQLLSMTLYNPHVDNREALKQVVLDFAVGKTALINDTDAPNYHEPYGPVETAHGQLDILGASLRYGVTQQFIDAEASIEQRKAVAEFAVDLVLSAVPFGKAADRLTGSQLAESLPEGLVRDAVVDMGKTVITDGTQQLTGQARAAIVEAVAGSFEGKSAEEIEAAIVEGIVTSLNDSDVRVNQRRAINDLHDRASN